MVTLTISKPGEPPRTERLEGREITIGRVAGNDVVLADAAVSSHHARMSFEHERAIIVDLGSTNGTFVNGKRIQGSCTVSRSDELYLGAYRIEFEVAEAVSPHAGASIPPMVSPPDALAQPHAVPQPVPPVAHASFPPLAAVATNPTSGGAASASTSKSLPTLPPLLGAVDAREPVTANVDTANVSIPPPTAPPTLPPPPEPLPNSPDASPHAFASKRPSLIEVASERPPNTAAWVEPVTPALPTVGRTGTPRTVTGIGAKVPTPTSGITEQILASLALLPSRATAKDVHALVFAALRKIHGVLPPPDEATRVAVREQATDALTRASLEVEGLEPAEAAEAISRELCGLGPLAEPLMAEDVERITVEGPASVRLHRRDREPLAAPGFTCGEAVATVVRRMTGQAFDAAHPWLETVLPDGRVVSAVHDVAVRPGPQVRIVRSKHTTGQYSIEALLADGTLSPVLANLLAIVVNAGLGVLICAGPGADAYPVLMALADATPADEAKTVVQLEPRSGGLPANTTLLRAILSDEPARAATAAIRSAVALGCERLFVHALIGEEAHELVTWMHRVRCGTVATLRANHVAAAIDGLLALTSDARVGERQHSAARRIADAFPLVVCVDRCADGRQRITQVAETSVAQSGALGVLEIFVYHAANSAWLHTGAVPAFFADLQRRGIAVDQSLLSVDT